MTFTPRLTSDGMQGSPWWYSSGNPFYPTYGLPNCTCYAYGRYAEARGAFAALPTGNAGLWYDAATSFQRGSTPALGAVICYNPGQTSTEVGHVAIVEVINSDGSIVISQSAYGGTYFWTETVTPSNGYLSSWMRNYGYYCAGFIYNDFAPGPLPVQKISDYVIAAMLGCWRWESGVNPGIWESLVVKDWHYVYGTDGPNMGGYGLGQWTNTGGDPNGRLWRLHDWVTSNGYADGDGRGQIAYIPVENTWHQNSVMGYTTLDQFLHSQSTDIDLLVEEFLACWEGVPGNHLAERRQYAHDFYNYIQANKNRPSSAFQWTSRNGYLTSAEMYANAMAAYFQLRGMGGFYLYGAIRDVLRRLIIHA